MKPEVRSTDCAAGRQCILITRPRIDAEPLAAILAEHGVSSLIEPLMEAVFMPEPKVDLTGVQALLATSANGVRAFAATKKRRDLPLCAVGEATAAAARDVGFPEVDVADGDVDALAGMIIASRDPSDGVLLHIAGTVSAGDLAGALAGAGFACRRAVLYRMEPVTALSEAAKQALAAQALTGVALYSPRTGRLFADLLDAATLTSACLNLTAYCLSAAVAEQVARLPWQARLIATRPDQPAMIAAILGANPMAR